MLTSLQVSGIARQQFSRASGTASQSEVCAAHYRIGKLKYNARRLTRICGSSYLELYIICCRSILTSPFCKKGPVKSPMVCECSECFTGLLGDTISNAAEPFPKSPSAPTGLSLRSTTTKSLARITSELVFFTGRSRICASVLFVDGV